MALQRTVIDIPLGGGLETKADPKVVQPGSSLVVENGEFDVVGALSKRNGYTALSRTKVGGGSISAGAGLLANGDELLMADGSSLYAWMPSLSQWKSRGTYRPIGVRTRRLGTSSLAYAFSCDVAVIGNIMVAIHWDINGAVKATVTDLQSGSQIQSATTVMTSPDTPPRIAVAGSYFYVVGIDTPNLKMAYLDYSSPASWSATSNLQTNATTAGVNIANEAIDGSGDEVVCVYESSTPDVRVFKFNTGGATAGPTTVAENSQTNFGLTITSTGNIFVAYQLASLDVRCFALSDSLVSLFAATTIDATAVSELSIVGIEVPSGGGAVQWYYNGCDTGSSALTGTHHRINVVTISIAGAVSGLAIFLRGCIVASEPVSIGGTVHLWVANQFDPTLGGATRSTQAGFYFVDSSGVVHAKTLVGSANLYSYTAANTAPSKVATYGSLYLFAAGAVFSSGLVEDTYYPQPTLIEWDTLHKPTAARIGENLLLSGGLVHEYDGGALYESGFHEYPHILYSDSGAGTIGTGTFQFTACYAYFDYHGQLHLGPPAPVQSVTFASGAANRIRLAISHLKLTNKSGAFILVYCTEASGSVFYEIENIANSKTTDDSLLEITGALLTNITDNRVLYTAGGTLDNGAPPASMSIVRKGKRVYSAAEDGVINYSKEHVVGETAHFVPETLVAALSEDGGDAYALGVLDGNLAAFGENGIQILSGEGLNDTGNLSTLSTPAQVSTDIGAAAGSQPLSTDIGLFFKSGSRGVNLLARSLQVEYIGAPVEAYNSLTFASAVAVQPKRQVRIGHTDGSCLVYDMTAGRWSVFTSHSQVAACMWSGSYCWLKSDGTVYKQSTAFVDDASSIGLVVETPWVRVGAISGYQRTYYVGVIGVYKSAHTLSLKVYYDYDDDVAETITFDLSTGYTAADPINLRAHLGRKCKAVKFRLEDSAQAGTKESLSLTGLSLELGIKGGIFRLGASQTG